MRIVRAGDTATTRTSLCRRCGHAGSRLPEPLPLAQLQPPVLVHPQQSYSCSADRRRADDFAPAPREVFVPIIEPRMKQARQFARLRVQAGKVRAFVEITVVTRQSQVCLRVFSSMLPGNNVFNVKRQRFPLLRSPQYSQRLPARSLTH